MKVINMQEKMIGRIIGNISNTYKIKTNEGIYEAYARGRFKNEEITPLVGDIVEIEITNENNKELTAIIEKIQPRKNEIKVATTPVFKEIKSGLQSRFSIIAPSVFIYLPPHAHTHTYLIHARIFYILINYCTVIILA